MLPNMPKTTRLPESWSGRSSKATKPLSDAQVQQLHVMALHYAELDASERTEEVTRRFAQACMAIIDGKLAIEGKS
jgi:hypothetical protein